MPKSKYTPEERLERTRMLGRAAYQRRKEKVRAYYQANKERYRNRDIAWRKKNKEAFDAQQLAYREGRKEQLKQYRESIREQMRPYNREWARKRRQCPIHRLKECMRTRVKYALKQAGAGKAPETMAVVGCTIEFLKKYLEARFKEGMTWENYGSFWHVDHVIPLAEAKTPSEVMRLSHYTNMQPLHWQENLSKGKKRPRQRLLDLG